jgi:hypothetical protein
VADFAEYGASQETQKTAKSEEDKQTRVFDKGLKKMSESLSRLEVQTTTETQQKKLHAL